MDDSAQIENYILKNGCLREQKAKLIKDRFSEVFYVCAGITQTINCDIAKAYVESDVNINNLFSY